MGPIITVSAQNSFSASISVLGSVNGFSYKTSVQCIHTSAMAEYFKGFFPGWSHSANPSWAIVAENGSISPQWVTFSMGHAGASRKSPNDAPWETLSLRLSRPISTPFLTVARSWRHEKKNQPVVVDQVRMVVILIFPYASLFSLACASL